MLSSSTNLYKFIFLNRFIHYNALLSKLTLEASLRLNVIQYLLQVLIFDFVFQA